jgi:hypothetical protein
VRRSERFAPILIIAGRNYLWTLQEDYGQEDQEKGGLGGHCIT